MAGRPKRVLQKLHGERAKYFVICLLFPIQTPKHCVHTTLHATSYMNTDLLSAGGSLENDLLHRRSKESLLTAALHLVGRMYVEGCLDHIPMPVHMGQLLTPCSRNKVLKLAAVTREVYFSDDVLDQHISFCRVGRQADEPCP